MKKAAILFLLCVTGAESFGWGFYGHQRINYYAVFMLPPEMLAFYKPNIQFLSDHSVDPDKRRYAVAAEGPKHFIDIDRYGTYPYADLPRHYDSAIKKFTEDTVLDRGVVAWWIQIMQARLTRSFRERDAAKILKISAELGHYVADSHVPLHTNSNHDGQYTNQKGIHAFWESRVPELLAEKEFDFMIGKASYIQNIEQYTWSRILESAVAADTVLHTEASVTRQFTADGKFAFEERNGKFIKQYSRRFTAAYHLAVKGMVERRMRTAIASVACLWYTAWVNAGQPNLKNLQKPAITGVEQAEFDVLEAAWNSKKVQVRPHE